MGREVFDHGFTTTEDGSGYGHSIDRTIGNAHGWDVTTSEGESGGAGFEFTGVEFVDDRTGGQACDGRGYGDGGGFWKRGWAGDRRTWVGFQVRVMRWLGGCDGRVEARFGVR